MKKIEEEKAKDRSKDRYVLRSLLVILTVSKGAEVETESEEADHEIENAARAVETETEKNDDLDPETERSGQDREIESGIDVNDRGIVIENDLRTESPESLLSIDLISEYLILKRKFKYNNLDTGTRHQPVLSI